jgi:hypothetical protein
VSRRRSDGSYVVADSDGRDRTDDRSYRWMKDPTPAGLTLVTRKVRDLTTDKVKYSYATVTHDGSGMSIRGFGGLVDGFKYRGRWEGRRVNDPVQEARGWLCLHADALAAIDWTRSAAELRADPAVRALLAVTP